MKVVQFAETGGSDVLKLADVPKPSPKPTEVLIKVEYSGVNFIDTYRRTGLYPVPLPCITGLEAAGVIEALGAEVAPEYKLKVGDRVGAWVQGSAAEYAVAAAKYVLHLPSHVSTRDGAAVLLQGLTALTLLRDAHEVKPGETILVQAAAGGTGGMLVQIGKALGATVIGTTSTEAKAETARANGCDHVIIYKEKDVEEEVMKMTEGKGCHAVYSGIGKATAEADLNMTRRKGTFVTFGNSSGAIESVKPLDLAKNNVKLVRPTLFNYLIEREDFVTRSSELLALVEKGAVKVNIGGEYALADVGKAQDALVSQKTVGKLVIKI
ncbi:quinone oxidoreductase [Pseudomassariella vexata]|uniref:Probable quinone oxidoreductase n=1 Tax=Pseudomassariella vexata TaxID=1141098 RepID=A0A1Y2EB15_9PEZI|nr:quinone oxidoreductase [Pseudomassariella vexata]ORY68759.1 quinone oxidoreductase [Pseudomassariella vexata]